MDKIGILTFHRPNNFGAVLQAYALRRIVAENGYDCEIIDYRNPVIEDNYHYTSLKQKAIHVARFLLYRKHFLNMCRKNRKFSAFRDKYLVCSQHYKNLSSFQNVYDQIIVGSDQIWNMDITGNDKTFFLPYEKGAKKLSYAASFGSSRMIADSVVDCDLLRKFSSLLVREEEGRRYLAEQVNPKAEKVFDPTLLLKREQWEELCKPYDGATSGKFIVMYFVAPYTNAVKLAQALAERYGLTLYWLDPGRHIQPQCVGVKDIGPDEFLWFLKNAEYVVTTSYHGLILSMNLNTRFLFELNQNKTVNTNSRLRDVMQTFGLEQYQIQSDDATAYGDLPYDWERLNRTIERERKISKDKLLHALCEETKEDGGSSD